MSSPLAMNTLRRLLAAAVAALLAVLPLRALAEREPAQRQLSQMQKGDFFRFFNLVHFRTDKAATLHRDRLHFRPSGERFQKLVTLSVQMDGKPDQVGEVALSVSRQFIDDRTMGMFARDIVKSFLQANLTAKDAQAMGDLVNEIWHHTPPGTRRISIAEAPPLPATPTPGYQVFLGSAKRFERELVRDRLTLENRADYTGGAVLVVTFRPIGR